MTHRSAHEIVAYGLSERKLKLSLFVELQRQSGVTRIQCRFERVVRRIHIVVAEKAHHIVVITLIILIDAAAATPLGIGFVLMINVSCQNCQ